MHPATGNFYLKLDRTSLPGSLSSCASFAVNGFSVEAWGNYFINYWRKLSFLTRWMWFLRALVYREWMRLQITMNFYCSALPIRQ
jgi:hypothetical protein